MPPRPLFVYLLASRSRALYVGVTNDAARRSAEHRAGWSAHTARYGIDRLVRVEAYAAPQDALRREKQLKGWSRSKKVALVESENPTRRDLDASRYGWGGAARLGSSKRMGTRRDPSAPLRSARDDMRGEGEQSGTGSHRRDRDQNPSIPVIPNRQVGAASLSRALGASQDAAPSWSGRGVRPTPPGRPAMPEVSTPPDGSAPPVCAERPAPPRHGRGG